MFRIAHVVAAFHAAHKHAEEGNGEITDGTGGAIGCFAHFVHIMRQRIVKAFADMREQFCRRNNGGFFNGIVGNQRTTAVKCQLQNFGHIQPTVRGVAVVLAHDEGLLTAGNGVISQIFLFDISSGQNLEYRVIVKQGGGQHAGRKEEAAHRTI